MRIALDTNILSLQWWANPLAAEMERLVVRLGEMGTLVIAGAVYAELYAHPRVDRTFVDDYLRDAGIGVDFETSAAMWHAAAATYGRYCERRRRSGGGEPRRLLADFLIGAHAQLHADALATLDRTGFAGNFPSLRLLP